MTEEQGRRIPIIDRRVAHQDTSGAPPVDATDRSGGVEGSAPATEAQTGAQRDPLIIPEGSSGPVLGRIEPEQDDFLDDLKRLQADFDNYRKRMMREQAATAGRAKARLMEQLLPVLDAFDQALEHEGDPGGLKLIYKQLKATLEAEGLEEIPAEGVAFDPHVHDAVDSREDPNVQEIVTQSVYRRGYRVGDQVLRAAMVVVARPPEVSVPETPEEDGSPSPEAAEG